MPRSPIVSALLDRYSRKSSVIAGVIAPATALAPSVTLLGWLSLSPLVYEVRDRFVSQGVWMPASWPLALIGAGWVCGLAIDAARTRLRSGAQNREVRCSPSTGW